MSKTNDSVRELRDDELESVSGGLTANFDMWNFSFAGDGLGSAHSLMGGYKSAASEGWGN